MRQAPPAQNRISLATDAETARRTARRRRVERLIQHADHLAPADAFLIYQVYRLGLSVAHIAQQSNRPRVRVYDRLHTLLRRLRCPLFAFVAAQSALLLPDVRATAELVICQGLTRQQAARITGRKIHAIRQDLLTLRGLARL